LETRITAVFRNALIDAYVASGRSWFVTLEDPITDPNFGTEEGRNDLNFYPSGHYGQTIFFTVECKRLHVTRKSGFVDLVNAYVDEGMQRFISGQYSGGLPCGGMVGYVMDNQLKTAFAKLQNEIRRRLKQLCVQDIKSIRKPSSTLPSYEFSTDTKHGRSDGKFTLHHLLLGVHK
jgi:hypothetical protein